MWQEGSEPEREKGLILGNTSRLNTSQNLANVMSKTNENDTPVKHSCEAFIHEYTIEILKYVF